MAFSPDLCVWLYLELARNSQAMRSSDAKSAKSPEGCSCNFRSVSDVSFESNSYDIE